MQSVAGLDSLLPSLLVIAVDTRKARNPLKQRGLGGLLNAERVGFEPTVHLRRHLLSSSVRRIPWRSRRLQEWGTAAWPSGVDDYERRWCAMDVRSSRWSSCGLCREFPTRK